MVQDFTDKPTTRLKANATVVYPVLVGVLDFNLDFRRYVIDHGHSFVHLSPVSTSTSHENDEVEDRVGKRQLASSSVPPLHDLLPASMKRYARIRKFEDLHDSVRKILKSLGDSVQSGFPVMSCDRLLVCHVALVSYCCDVPEGKDISAVRHGGTMDVSMYLLPL